MATFYRTEHAATKAAEKFQRDFEPNANFVICKAGFLGRGPVTYTVHVYAACGVLLTVI